MKGSVSRRNNKANGCYKSVVEDDDFFLMRFREHVMCVYRPLHINCTRIVSHIE